MADRDDAGEFADLHDDEPDDDPGDPQPRDIDAFGGEEEDEETIPCPQCGAPMWEHAERCSACGEYVTADSVRIGGRGLLVAGVLVAAMLVATFFLWR